MCAIILHATLAYLIKNLVFFTLFYHLFIYDKNNNPESYIMIHIMVFFRSTNKTRHGVSNMHRYIYCFRRDNSSRSIDSKCIRNQKEKTSKEK